MGEPKMHCTHDDWTTDGNGKALVCKGCGARPKRIGEGAPDSDRGDLAPVPAEYYIERYGLAPTDALVQALNECQRDAFTQGEPNAPRGDVDSGNAGEWKLLSRVQWEEILLARSRAQAGVDGELGPYRYALEMVERGLSAAIGRDNSTSAAQPTPQAVAVSELKACPWCGSAPVVVRDKLRCLIRCRIPLCGARAYETETEAIAAWNTRAT